MKIPLLTQENHNINSYSINTNLNSLKLSYLPTTLEVPGDQLKIKNKSK